VNKKTIVTSGNWVAAKMGVGLSNTKMTKNGIWKNEPHLA
jgi:hypothetical protein